MLCRLFTIVAALSLAACAAAQTTITLRTNAQLAANAQELRLSDIADVTGPDADAINGVVLIKEPSPGRDGVVTVTVAAVRAALNAAPGVNMGKLSMRGSTCVVRVGDGPVPSRAPDTVKGSVFRPVAVELTGTPTLRAAVAARLAALYGVEMDHLRLGFDPSDDGLLATPTGGQIVEVSPGASASSARVPVTVNMYAHEQLTLSKTIQVEASVNRAVVKAAAAIERGKVIVQDDLTSAEQWVSPSTTPPLAIEDVIGSVAQKRIGAGEVVDPDDVAAPLACKRGDTVVVSCISGVFVVKSKARALATARDGELVQLKTEGSDEIVTARMSGHGRAVMMVQAPPSGPGMQVYRPSPTSKPKPSAKKVLSK